MRARSQFTSGRHGQRSERGSPDRRTVMDLKTLCVRSRTPRNKAVLCHYTVFADSSTRKHVLLPGTWSFLKPRRVCAGIAANPANPREHDLKRVWRHRKVFGTFQEAQAAAEAAVASPASLMEIKTPKAPARIPPVNQFIECDNESDQSSQP